jgi:predicted nucleotidyltransferase
MIDFEQIQALSQHIAKKFQPNRIILFGSYAYGQPTEGSDIDLLVILPFEEPPVCKAIEIRREIKSPFPLDLMARTPKQIQQRLEMGDFFIQDILQKGLVLYEANHARVDQCRRRFCYRSTRTSGAAGAEL